MLSRERSAALLNLKTVECTQQGLCKIARNGHQEITRIIIEAKSWALKTIHADTSVEVIVSLCIYHCRRHGSSSRVLVHSMTWFSICSLSVLHSLPDCLLSFITLLPAKLWTCLGCLNLWLSFRPPALPSPFCLFQWISDLLSF